MIKKHSIEINNEQINPGLELAEVEVDWQIEDHGVVTERPKMVVIPKSFEITNREKFAERWIDLIEDMIWDYLYENETPSISEIESHDSGEIFDERI